MLSVMDAVDAALVVKKLDYEQEYIEGREATIHHRMRNPGRRQHPPTRACQWSASGSTISFTRFARTTGMAAASSL